MSRAQQGIHNNYTYPDNDIMSSYLLRHDWMETEYNMWQHPDHKAYGFGLYRVKDAFRLQKDFDKRGKTIDTEWIKANNFKHPY